MPTCIQSHEVVGKMKGKLNRKSGKKVRESADDAFGTHSLHSLFLKKIIFEGSILRQAANKQEKKISPVQKETERDRQQNTTYFPGACSS